MTYWCPKSLQKLIRFERLFRKAENGSRTRNPAERVKIGGDSYLRGLSNHRLRSALIDRTDLRRWPIGFLSAVTEGGPSPIVWMTETLQRPGPRGFLQLQQGTLT